MPIAAIKAYLERLPARQAEMKLTFADAVSVPHMKEHDRKTITSNWLRTANIHQVVKARPATAARLKLMGIGVEHVQ